ncbi:uncharacterized protein EI90DRAFT_3126308 [Cantharellus anzutake]|uniref:uncharacterized protein n=1 Tax=Cantharellus anzutake TaxID=1750568 RepID=UPI001902D1F9|nr:uncharacterized protein EI90DRAFT_3126308 [Cantharellus anzutake]KAF8328133.1 hypothetical protein EI90DRAFT_3126308 [Cantharellus anzutake]
MSNKEEPTFRIQPHPAKEKDNNPQPGPDLSNRPGFEAYKAGGPQVLSDEQLSKLEKPLSREELRKRAEELNK